MGSITFIEHDGTQHQAELEPGKSLMQIAMDNGVPGIDADCGGECACGTCHVIVDSAWLNVAGKAGPEELQMLEMTPEKNRPRAYPARSRPPTPWTAWSSIFQSSRCKSASPHAICFRKPTFCLG